MSSASAAEFDPLSEQLLAAARERQASTLSRSERLTYWSAVVGFCAVAALLLVFGRQTPLPAAWVLGLLVVTYALASRLEFEVGSTLAIATQLVLVEMLFLLPPAQLPLWVLAGSLLSQLPGYLRRSVPPERMLVVIGSSWFVFGPALVLTLLPVEPSTGRRRAGGRWHSRWPPSSPSTWPARPSASGLRCASRRGSCCRSCRWCSRSTLHLPRSGC